MVSDPDVNTGATADLTGTGRSAPGLSYLAKNWRGDLSLGVSYWANLLLASFAVFLMFFCLGLLVAPDNHPLIFALAASVAWVSAVVINVWHIVGVWRSARHHKARGGCRLWAATARVAVALGLLCLAGSIVSEIIPQIAEYWRIAAGDPGMNKREMRILRGGRELEYDGWITFGAADEVRSLLDANPAIRLIELNSLGGRIGEAHKPSDLIRQRQLVTYTGSDCVSACTIAFMGGVQRLLAADAALGFHRGSFPGFTEGEPVAFNDEERRWLIESGVAPWFADRAYSTPSSSVWWPTAEELKRASVITGVADPADFAPHSPARSHLLEIAPIRNSATN